MQMYVKTIYVATYIVKKKYNFSKNILYY